MMTAASHPYSVQQRKILNLLLAGGQSQVEIANTLHLSPKTVNAHLAACRHISGKSLLQMAVDFGRQLERDSRTDRP